MEKKPKIIKLPDGYANGYDTYGSICKPKGGAESKAYELKSRAAQRITMLMKNGSQGDHLTRKEEPLDDDRQIEDLEFRNKLAESPKLVQFAYWCGKLNDLRKELNDLEATQNKRKIDLTAPTIKIQIELVENTIRELFDDIKKERKVIFRTTNMRGE